MVRIINDFYSKEKIGKDDLFICAIGYEQRSYFLYDQLRDSIKADQILILLFDDHSKYDHTNIAVAKIKEKDDSRLYVCGYQDYKSFEKAVEEFLLQNMEEFDSLRIHVDYSSMPRSWYSRLPQIFEKVLMKNAKVFFWYVEGTYPEGYDEYPSAGIESFSLFSGQPTLRIENKRIHVLSLGYDTIRTQAIASILDPESMIVCNAYNSKNREISERVKEINRELIAQSVMTISLQIDDFSFMISKLCELAYEYQPTGDVIFIPDGPKPLILAMSLIPDVVKLKGVTCLHIARNQEHFNPIDVLPKENIWGFSMEFVETQ